MIRPSFRNTDSRLFWIGLNLEFPFCSIIPDAIENVVLGTDTERAQILTALQQPGVLLDGTFQPFDAAIYFLDASTKVALKHETVTLELASIFEMALKGDYHGLKIERRYLKGQTKGDVLRGLIESLRPLLAKMKQGNKSLDVTANMLLSWVDP